MSPQHRTSNWYRYASVGLLLQACNPGAESMDAAGPGGASQAYFGPPLELGNRAPDGPGQDNPWLGSGGSLGWGGDVSRGGPLGPESGGRTSQASGGTLGLPPRRIDGVLRFHSYEETATAAKYLGLTHVGGGAVLAGDCTIEVYSNGNDEKPYRRIGVPALAAGAQAELCTQEAGHPGCLPVITASPFNGNDALLLWCGGRLVDSFGQLGVDPGTAWSGGGVSSKDQRLLRCSVAADQEPRDVFVIEDDWVTQAPIESSDAAKARCPASTDGPGLGGARSTQAT